MKEDNINNNSKDGSVQKQAGKQKSKNRQPARKPVSPKGKTMPKTGVSKSAKPAKVSVKQPAKNTGKTSQRRNRKNSSKLKIIPLGGLEQIGMNITAFEYEDSIVVVDCGMSFPEDDMLGIDFVIPDVTYLKENITKVKGFVITHGHEDHIGALPYVLKEVKAPIYSTKLTLGLISNKLREHNLLNTTKMKEVKHGQVINLGDFSIEFIKTNHSIQDASALAIYSRQELLSTQETLRWIIPRFSVMPLIYRDSQRLERKAFGSDVRQYQCRAARIYHVRTNRRTCI